MMETSNNGVLLRTFISKNARSDGSISVELIVKKTRALGLAGATVFRSIMDFQGENKIQNSTILRPSENIPIVTEIADTELNINKFLPFLTEAVTDGLVTTEKANIIIQPKTTN
ncbi:MAG: DUF190 domain-containing protein [Bacteroidetes bacterium]|nr:DUF190 domain-containing protein [Bacteroidota bacterium]